MDLTLLTTLAEKNASDIETVISTLGIANILKVLPQLQNILTTVQQHTAANPTAPTA